MINAGFSAIFSVRLSKFKPHSAKKFYGTMYSFWLTFIYSAESITPDESLPELDVSRRVSVSRRF